MRMGKNVKIEFSAGAALLLGALYFVLDWDGLGALLLAAAAHEAGHFAALRLTGGRVSGVRADVCGAVIERRGAVSLWGEVFCAAAGPLLREHSPMQALDIAIARRILPAVLATAPVEALKALPEMVTDLEECRKLLESPLPIF